MDPQEPLPDPNKNSAVPEDVAAKDTAVEDIKSQEIAANPKNPSFFYKIILSLLALIGIIGMTLSTCSSPPPPSKTFLIGMDKNWYPLQLMGKEKSMSAFCELLLYAIAKNQKLSLKIFDAKTDELFRDLESEKYDGVLSVLTPIFPSTHEYIYSEPIYKLGIVLVVSIDSPLHSVDDLSNKIIGVVGNIPAYSKIILNPSTVLSSYNTATEALFDLDQGKIDGIIMDSLLANSYLQGLYAGRFKIVPPLLTLEGIKLILISNEQAKNFLNLFNEGLNELRENGEYTALLKAWGLIKTENQPSISL